MKRLLITPVISLLVIVITGSCTSSSNKDKSENDSIAIAQLEAARLDSLRQDSINRRNFTTPDLAFNDLHGDVKKCEINTDYYFTYDEEGNWTNSPNWTAEDKKYCPDRTKHPRVSRNKDGYITRIYEDCDADYEYEDINWKDGRIKKRAISNYSYDDNGLMIGREDDEDFDYKRWATYCNYEVDAMGNWIKRDVIEKCINTFDNATNYTTTTETRQITYYTSDGGKPTSIPNNAKQEQALQAVKSFNQEKEQEDKKGPEWINGIWEVNTTVSTAMGSMRVNAKVCIDRDSQQFVATDCGSTVARGIYRINGNSIICGDLYIDMDMSNQRLEYGSGIYYRRVSTKYL